MVSLVLVGCATTVKSLQPGVPVAEKEKYSYFYGSCQRPFLGLKHEIVSPELNLFIKYQDEGKGTERLKLSYDIEKRDEKELFLFKIKPGKYTFYQLALENFKQTKNIDFEVKENSVYYLGYINFERDLLNIIGNSVSINISNDEKYDKKNLIDKYKFLEKSKFEILSAD